MMETEQIVALLIVERDRLARAIEALQGSAKRRGRPPGSTRKGAALKFGDQTTANVAPTLAAEPVPVRHKRKLSAAGRKAIAEGARKRWAAIKAGKAPSPFAKSSKIKKPKKA
jgi:hypothetical protein